MKIFKYLNLFLLISMPVVIVSTINQNRTINNQVTVNLKMGQIDDPTVTEEQKKAAQDKFWMEFGITAGVLVLIISICLIIYFTKRRK